MEAVSVNCTENTRLYFACPTAEDTDADDFLDSLEGQEQEPTFTYPFFGQEELWKGVAEGSLDICFDPRSCYAYVSFEVDEDAEELKDELLAKLTEKMPADGWTSDWAQFVKNCQEYSGVMEEFGTVEATFIGEEGQINTIISVLHHISNRLISSVVQF